MDEAVGVCLVDDGTQRGRFNLHRKICIKRCEKHMEFIPYYNNVFADVWLQQKYGY
jgi:hypothetical protein